MAFEMNTALLLLAQAPAPTAPSWIAYLPLIGMIVIFYLIVLLPRQRELKRHAQMVESLQKGDAVVTAGGIIGEITAIRDNQITLRSGGSTLIVEKQRVMRKKSEGK